MKQRTVLEPAARLLVESGAVRGARVVRAGERWAVVLLVGLEEYTVSSKREPVRLWASLDTLAEWLKDLGLARADLHMI